MNPDFEVIVVGGGLAGCAMSAELRDRGVSVAMIDEPHLSACSRHAMGILNPLVVRSLRLQEQLTEAGGDPDFLDSARSRYGSLLQDRAVLHLFAENAERERWEALCGTPGNPHLGQTQDGALPAPWEAWRFEHPQGWASIGQTALLDVNAFLNREHAALHAEGRLFAHALSDHELVNHADGIVCARWSARTAIFCEGWRSVLSTFWQRLSLKPAKGELLTVSLGGPAYEADEELLAPILHRDIHVVARSLNASRIVSVGSTYSWDDITETHSTKARAELLYKLERLHDGPVQVIEQFAGIRPSSRDRRPIIGVHPEHPHMAILNGLGTRGVMLAPGLAWLLANALEGDDCIPPVWNASRFWFPA